MRETLHVKTGAGRIAVRMSQGQRTPLLLIHGNSMSAAAFDDLLSSPLGRSYRLIAADLPGHGASDDAAFPDRAYTLPGYADAMLDVLFALDACDAAICGWSLGGHIAMEMMTRSARIAGAFAIAAPPVAPGANAICGFNVTDELGLFMTEGLSDAQTRHLAEVCTRAPAPDFAYAAARRADGRARRIVIETILNGCGGDPAPLFQDARRPVALVTGERETMTSRDYLSSVTGPGLWRGRFHEIEGAGHAPFLDAPGAFNALLLDFIRDVARGRRAASARRPAAA